MSTPTVEPRATPGGTPPKPQSAGAAPAGRTDDIVIGMGVTSSGKFTTAGSICVDGILADADVEAASLSISRGGEFHGMARVGTVEVFGTLCGEVHASEQIVLRASAVVVGKVSAPYITTHRGAAISGEVKSLERRPELQPPQAPQRSAGKGMFRRSGFPAFLGGMLLLTAGGGAALGWLMNARHQAAVETVAEVRGR